MFKKYFYTIQMKLFLLVAILVTVSLFTYLAIAVGLFKKDKTAYIYGTSLATAQSLEAQVTALLHDVRQNSSLLMSFSSQVSQKKASQTDLLGAEDDIVYFTAFKRSSGSLRQTHKLINSEFIEKQGITLSQINSVDFEKLASTVPPGKTKVENLASWEGPALLALLDSQVDANVVVISVVRLDRLNSPFVSNAIYRSYLVNNDGIVIAHSDVEKIKSAANISQEPAVSSLLTAEVPAGVREFGTGEKTTLVGYSRVRDFNLLLVSEIEKNKAFAVSQELTQKSVIFGIFILSTALLLGTVFARTLTQPLRKLVQGTLELGSGNFSTQVQVKSKDEIGILAYAFNVMAQRIASLLEKEKEKIALEKDLEVAKLVQNTFFPEPILTCGKLRIAGFYEPSALCGGDWWNVIHEGNKTLVFIGDATGHGVPSALVTAAAASVRSILQELKTLDEQIVYSPSRFLQLMNKAIYHNTNGKVLMTFFAALIDTEKGTLTYCNASHNPPLVYKPSGNEPPNRKNLKPLNLKIGPSLGINETATFENVTVPFEKNDVLLAYTDGLIECTNSNNEEWGKKNLYETLMKKVGSEAEVIRDSIALEAQTFFNNEPAKDDITFVVAKFV